jgi:hypothetical protein
LLNEIGKVLYFVMFVSGKIKGIISLLKWNEMKKIKKGMG